MNRRRSRSWYPSGAQPKQAPKEDDVVMIFRYKDGSEWKPVPMSLFSGLTGEECLRALEGTESVAEYREGESRGYLCGTKKWLDYYRSRGHKALSFEEAADKLKRTQPHIADAVWPEMAREAEAVFGECGLVEVRSKV